MSNETILILGVTAGGKGGLAFELARKIDAEIISIDSMKVYRRMDIATAKPSKEYRKYVKYHLIDVVEPSESFSVDRFLDLAKSAVKQICSANKEVIVVGGTAMYIKAFLYGIFDGPGTNERIRQELKEKIKLEGCGALHQQLSGLDPIAAERIHPNDARRIVRALEVYHMTGRPISDFQQQFKAENPLENWKIVGLRRKKTDASRRINARVRKIMETGLVDEVKSLLNEEKPLSRQARCAIGYAEIIHYLNGGTNLEDAVENIKVNTRRFAKSQRTWFKTFKNVNWLDVTEDEPAENILNRTLKIIGRD